MELVALRDIGSEEEVRYRSCAFISYFTMKELIRHFLRIDFDLLCGCRFATSYETRGITRNIPLRLSLSSLHRNAGGQGRPEVGFTTPSLWRSGSDAR
jgi:hypothetical protein